MERQFNKRRSSIFRGPIAARPPVAVRVVPVSPAPFVRTFHLLLLLGLVLLVFFSQGCAVVGTTLLGAAASTATKTGVSYTLDSRANKTFTAPLAEVRASLVAALGEMAFPIETDEKTDEGHRIVARSDEREVEADLEAVTPKATKIRVVVREGWFWKDRATAEEIVEQTGRGVEATMIAAKGGALVHGFPTAWLKALPGGEPRPVAAAPAAQESWDPQRWREGFRKAPGPSALVASSRPPPVVAGHGGSPGAGTAPAGPPVAVAFPMIAVGGGLGAPPPDASAPAGGGPARPAMLAGVDARPRAGATGNGATGDMRWRVLHTRPLRPCPDTACVGAVTVKQGELVVHLREKNQWSRVWVAGTDVVGWIPRDDLAPPPGAEPSPGPIAVSAPTPR